VSTLSESKSSSLSDFTSLSPSIVKEMEGDLPKSQSDSSGFISFSNPVSSITPSGIYGEEVDVQGIRWKLLLRKKSASSHLEAYLIHRTCDAGPWSVDVTAQFRLIGSSEEWSREMELNETFRNGRSRSGFSEFMPWSDIISVNKGFINSDISLTIEVQFTLSNIVGICRAIDFTDPNDSRHDIAFV
ncbi:hypothetical protein PMAYCL1PPCAC_25706, partial [Pristionchus mayeri]